MRKPVQARAWVCSRYGRNVQSTPTEHRAPMGHRSQVLFVDPFNQRRKAGYHPVRALSCPPLFFRWRRLQRMCRVGLERFTAAAIDTLLIDPCLG